MGSLPYYVVTLRSLDAKDTRLAIRTFVIKPNKPQPIGRSSNNTHKRLQCAGDNAYIDSPVVSREHAVMTTNSVTGHPTVYIRDLGSMHGTSVNETPLTAHRDFKLKNGDVLKFGTTIMRDTHTYHCSKFEYTAYLDFERLETEVSSELKASRIYSVPPVESSDDEEDVEDGRSDSSEVSELDSNSSDSHGADLHEGAYRDAWLEYCNEGSEKIIAQMGKKVSTGESMSEGLPEVEANHSSERSHEGDFTDKYDIEDEGEMEYERETGDIDVSAPRTPQPEDRRSAGSTGHRPSYPAVFDATRLIDKEDFCQRAASEALSCNSEESGDEKEAVDELEVSRPPSRSASPGFKGNCSATEAWTVPTIPSNKTPEVIPFSQPPVCSDYKPKSPAVSCYQMSVQSQDASSSVQNSPRLAPKNSAFPPYTFSPRFSSPYTSGLESGMSRRYDNPLYNSLYGRTDPSLSRVIVNGEGSSERPSAPMSVQSLINSAVEPMEDKRDIPYTRWDQLPELAPTKRSYAPLHVKPAEQWTAYEPEKDILADMFGESSEAVGNGAKGIDSHDMIAAPSYSVKPASKRNIGEISTDDETMLNHAGNVNRRDSILENNQMNLQQPRVDAADKVETEDPPQKRIKISPDDSKPAGSSRLKAAVAFSAGIAVGAIGTFGLLISLPDVS